MDSPVISQGRPLASRRRAWPLGAAALAVAAAAIAVTTLVTRGGSLPKTRGTGTIVLPFEYLGEKESSYLGPAVTTLMGASLGTSGPLASVDPRAVASAVAARMPAGFNLAAAGDVSSQLGARYFIGGTIVRAQRAIRIEAALYEVGSASDPVARAGGEGTIDSLFVVADRVARNLLSSRIGAMPTAALGTTSMTALRAYLDGERELLGARYGDAADAFARAVAADTLFARGYFRLGYASGWAGRSAVALASTKRALALAPRLEALDQVLLSAWSDFLTGNTARARDSYERFLTLEPRSVEAWLQLAELRYHWGAMLGLSPEDAAVAFRRVLALAPDQASALVHLARLEAQESVDGAAFDSLARSAISSAIEPIEGVELEALLAMRRADSASRRVVLSYVSQSPEFAPRIIGLMVTVPRDPSLAREIARASTLRGKSSSRAHTLLLLAQIAAVRGRFHEAFEWLDTLSRTNPARALEARAWLALAPLRTVSRDEMRAVRAGLASADPDATLPPWLGAVEQMGIYPGRLLWLRGVLAAIDGDSTAMVAARSELAARRWPDTLGAALMRTYVRQIDAEWLRRSAPSAALTTLGVSQVEPGNTFPQIMSFPNARERHLRAELLAVAGRKDEALRWWSSFPDPSAYDAWFLGNALLQRAQLRAAEGDVGKARADYTRFIELWKDCDPELRSIVRDAQARRSALPSG